MPIADLAPEIAVLLCAVAIVLGALILPQKRLRLGAAVAIAFVMLYSVIDDLVKKYMAKDA